jgi:hypothetical protein
MIFYQLLRKPKAARALQSGILHRKRGEFIQMFTITPPEMLFIVNQLFESEQKASFAMQARNIHPHIDPISDLRNRRQVPLSTHDIGPFRSETFKRCSYLLSARSERTYWHPVAPSERTDDRDGSKE